MSQATVETAENQCETRIFGGPLNQVLPAIEQHNIGRLISIINKDTMIETPDVLDDHQHLKLAMNDISEPRDGLVITPLC